MKAKIDKWDHINETKQSKTKNYCTGRKQTVK
jgi:hypothetical protein